MAARSTSLVASAVASAREKASVDSQIVVNSSTVAMSPSRVGASSMNSAFSRSVVSGVRRSWLTLASSFSRSRK